MPNDRKPRFRGESCNQLPEERTEKPCSDSTMELDVDMLEDIAFSGSTRSGVVKRPDSKNPPK